MVAMSGAARHGTTGTAGRTLALPRRRLAVWAAVGAAIAVPWAVLSSAAFGQALPTGGSAVEVQRPQGLPEQSSVEETTHPVRQTRQVRVPSNRSVAPSDTSSVDAVTDDAAIGTVSSTDDDHGQPGLPAELDPATGLVGLDSHDHPWDERPPPIVDLGELVEPPPVPSPDRR